MTGLEVPHFEERGRVNPVQADDRLPQPIYSAALDYLVFACVDLVLTHQTQILLAMRKTEPRRSWWIIGGRMTAGESPLATAQRKAAQEASLLNLEPSRFQYIGVYSTCFARRAQAPQQHGSHSLNITYQLEVTRSEHAQICLNASEYETWQWIDRPAIALLLNPTEPLDAALLRIMQDLAAR